MEIEGDTIIFQSCLHSYRKEEDGRKPNTTRIIEERENNIVTVIYLKRIRIILKDFPSKEHFEREITDIAHIGDICGKTIITISWKHEEEVQE